MITTTTTSYTPLLLLPGCKGIQIWISRASKHSDGQLRIAFRDFNSFTKALLKAARFTCDERVSHLIDIGSMQTGGIGRHVVIIFSNLCYAHEYIRSVYL